MNPVNVSAIYRGISIIDTMCVGMLVLDRLEEKLGIVGVRLLATFDNRCVDVNSELSFGKWDRELCFVNLEVVEVVVCTFVQRTGLRR